MVVTPQKMDGLIIQKDEKCDGHNYGSQTVDVTVHHEATTKQVWKVDQKSYDEKVLVGYKCDCGSVKE